MKTWFDSAEQSHRHSLQTLETLYEFDDFMESINTLVDMGCGAAGQDLEWWATRTTRDDNPEPLNIRCLGVDQFIGLPVARQYRNISYRNQDFEQPLVIPHKFDVIWCHDAFQYVIDPIKTLKQWHAIANTGAMLILILPQTTNLQHNKQHFTQHSGCLWHWTMVNLIHMLVITGWNCRDGFFLKHPDDPWLHAAVYRGDTEFQDPKTSWYELADRGLLPESASKSVEQYGYLRQEDLVLPWINRSNIWMGAH